MEEKGYIGMYQDMWDGRVRVQGLKFRVQVPRWDGIYRAWTLEIGVSINPRRHTSQQ